MVARGGFLSDGVVAAPFCFLRDRDACATPLVDAPALAALSSGANAEARREEMSVSDQCFFILSGKRDGSSTTKTSDSLRRPRCFALFWSSFLRMWPRPSASPE